MTQVSDDLLDRVLRALQEAHTASVLKGVNVHWDVLEPYLRGIHEELYDVITPDKVDDAKEFDPGF